MGIGITLGPRAWLGRAGVLGGWLVLTQLVRWLPTSVTILSRPVWLAIVVCAAIVNFALVYMYVGWTLDPATRGDFVAWELATTDANPFMHPGWRYSPAAVWLFEPVVWMGLDAWRAAHFVVLLFLAPEWPLIALIAISFPFWIDVASGSVLTFALVPGLLALRGNRVAIVVSYALMLLMPRPLVAPLGIYLLWKQPWSRPWFVGLFVVHAALVLATGLADDWTARLLSTVGPEVAHEFNYAPSRWIGQAWIPVGLALAAVLTVRGWVGLAGLAASPYLFPYYFLVGFLEVGRAHQAPRNWNSNTDCASGAEP